MKKNFFTLLILQGKIKIKANNLKIVFRQQLRKNEIFYNRITPENGFEIKELR
jgi:hypothetical protein